MEMKTKRFRTWHALLVGILMFSLGLGVSFYGVVSANIQLPDPAFNAGVTRDPENGVVDPTKISDGPNKPTNPPGGDGNVIPSFSAINLPVITNKNGPVQVSDDLVVHGMTDVQEGIINGKGGDPVQIWDDVEVRGNGVETGNIMLGGEISSLNGVVTIAGAAKVKEGLAVGSLQVKKGGGDTTFQIDANGLISNPNAGLVTIADALEVQNNLEVAGWVNSQNSIVQGNLEVNQDALIRGGLDIQFGNLNVASGDLQVVVGTTTLNKLTVSGGAIVSNGLDVSGQAEFKGDVSLSSAGSLLDVSGKIKATEIKGNSIGSYYRLDKQLLLGGGLNIDLDARCGDGDIILSCVGHAGQDPPDFRVKYIGSWVTPWNPRDCYSTFKNTAVDGLLVYHQATCFNSDGSAIANQDGDVTQY